MTVIETEAEVLRLKQVVDDCLSAIRADNSPYYSATSLRHRNALREARSAYSEFLFSDLVSNAIEQVKTDYQNR